MKVENEYPNCHNGALYDEMGKKCLGIVDMMKAHSKLHLKMCKYVMIRRAKIYPSLLQY